MCYTYVQQDSHQSLWKAHWPGSRQPLSLGSSTSLKVALLMIKASPVIASTTICTICSVSDTQTSVSANLTGKPAHSRHSIDKDSWESGLGSNIRMMHWHNRTLALTFMAKFAMVKHNLEQAYGTPNGSGGTVTDALSGKIQSESCGHPDMRCRAHPLPPMLNRQHLLLSLSVHQWWCDAS